MLNLLRIALGAAVLASFSSPVLAQQAGSASAARNASNRTQISRPGRTIPPAFVDDCSNHPFSRGCDKRGQW